MMEEMMLQAVGPAGVAVVSVGFGLLMYRMANTTVKDNTKAFQELRLELQRWRLTKK